MESASINVIKRMHLLTSISFNTSTFSATARRIPSIIEVAFGNTDGYLFYKRTRKSEYTNIIIAKGVEKTYSECISWYMFVYIVYMHTLYVSYICMHIIHTFNAITYYKGSRKQRQTYEMNIRI
jgi:hypothetical protein